MNNTSNFQLYQFYHKIGVDVIEHIGKLKETKDRLLETQRLRAEIEQSRNRIDSARNHFEQAVEPTLVDCYIYESNAAQL